MCPLCLSTLAWVGLGGGSVSALAVIIGLKRKEDHNGDDRDDTPYRNA